MNSQQYWEKRRIAENKAQLMDAGKLERELLKAWKKARKEIEKELSVLYMKYANENEIEYADVHKALNRSQFKEWRMDLKEYIDLIKKTGDDMLLLELNMLSRQSSISILEEKLYQIDKYIEEIYKMAEDGIYQLREVSVIHSYNTNIFDIHKVIGIGTSFSYIDKKLVEQVLSIPWSGRQFSSIIWSNKTKLKQVLKQEITQGIIQGKGVKEIAQTVANRMDADFSNALKVVHTEHAFAVEKGTELAYQELGVEEYQYLATLDSRTSKICQKLDMKVFKLSEAKVGVNYPPMHPYCRSTTIPYLEGFDTVRTARNKQGKTIEVPASMTYDEWKRKFGV